MIAFYLKVFWLLKVCLKEERLILQCIYIQMVRNPDRNTGIQEINLYAFFLLSGLRSESTWDR